jgi:hypothetical protein
VSRKIPVWPSDRRRRENRNAQYEGGELRRQPPAKPVCGELNDDGNPCVKDVNHKGKC